MRKTRQTRMCLEYNRDQQKVARALIGIARLKLSSIYQTAVQKLVRWLFESRDFFFSPFCETFTHIFFCLTFAFIKIFPKENLLHMEADALPSIDEV